MFKIQARVWKQGLCTTTTLGQCKMDMEKYIEAGNGEHIFCLPEDTSASRSNMLPYIQLTLNPAQFESADTLTLAQNEDSEDIDPTASQVTSRSLSRLDAHPSLLMYCSYLGKILRRKTARPRRL